MFLNPSKCHIGCIKKEDRNETLKTRDTQSRRNSNEVEILDVVADKNLICHLYIRNTCKSRVTR